MSSASNLTQHVEKDRMVKKKKKVFEGFLNDYSIGVIKMPLPRDFSPGI